MTINVTWKCGVFSIIMKSYFRAFQKFFLVLISCCNVPDLIGEARKQPLQWGVVGRQRQQEDDRQRVQAHPAEWKEAAVSKATLVGWVEFVSDIFCLARESFITFIETRCPFKNLFTLSGGWFCGWHNLAVVLLNSREIRIGPNQWIAIG